MSARKRKKNKIILFVVELVVLAALLVGLYVYSLMSKVETPNLTEEEEQATKDSIELSSETAELLEEYTNIAIFGLDNRSTGNYDGGNSDCIMIASINNKTKEVKLVSVYRDTFLKVKADTYNKINSAYAYGGASNAMAALNQNLNLDIEDYVAVDFGAVVEAVDALGGIELTFTDQEAKIMNETYIDEINEVAGRNTPLLSGGGSYHADGVYALAYCRIRYTAGDDFKRTERQREVITKMIDKAKSSSLASITDLIKNMVGDIKTSYSSSEMIALASKMMDYEVTETHGWPFELCTGTFGAKDIVVATDLETNVRELHEYLFGEKTEVSDTVAAISDYILDYTGCGTGATSRFDNPLTGDDNTNTTDTGYAEDTEDAAE